MSQKEIDRYGMIQKVIRKEIKGVEAAKLLSLSSRQIKRLKARILRLGAKGLVHGNRGRSGNRRMPEKEKNKIVIFIRRHYADFGPTLASEKLRERHGIQRNPKTIRKIMIDEKLWKPRKRKVGSKHRAWRPRKASFGEMQQFDGSYHDWFEGRLRDEEGNVIKACLLASIDDATGRVTKAVFASHEGVFPVFGFWKGYLLSNGKPRLIYLDKFSTYRMNHQTARENTETLTQCERAMRDLGIELITAHSPQAKGRVERLFGTLQDRLIKELRLEGISTIHEADKFLEEVFIPKFNKQFSVEPVSGANLHRPLTKAEQKRLDSIFSRQSERTVQNDFTLSFKNQWYQLTEGQPVTVCKKDKVTVEERLDGSVHVRLKGKYLGYEILPERPKKITRNRPWVLAKTSLERRPYRPAPNHPWRKFHCSKELTKTS